MIFKLSILSVLLIACSYSFSIWPHKYQTIPSQSIFSPQKGNITVQEQNTIRRTITNAETDYSQTEYAKIAKNISLTLKSVLTGFRWSVYVFAKGIKQTVVSPDSMQKKKYISIIGYGKYNLSYQIYGTNQGAGCSQVGGGSSMAQFGQNITTTKQDQIKAIVNNSITYRGDDMQSAAAYIANKTMSILPGNRIVVISNPTTAVGFYICRYYEYWAALRNFGDFKWFYYILGM